jgi:hypothetical protein
MSPSRVGSSANDAAAQRAAQLAAERARAAAEAAAARAAAKAAAEAAAKAKAAAEAKRQEASTAQAKAREDGKNADQAQGVNKAAQEKKTTAQQELDAAKSALESKNKQLDERGPRPGDVERVGELKQKVNDAQARFDKAKAEADQAQKAAQEARATAEASKKDAIAKGNAAIEAQQTANTAARKAGEPEPFREANEVRDIFDAGSLDAAAQKKLLGGETAAVTPQEAARADAQRISEATRRSPAEGAEELQRQLKANNDPEYRKALQAESAASREKIISALENPALSAEDANTIVKSLAGSAELAGPEATADLARQLNDVGSGSFVDLGAITARQHVLDGLKANANDPKSVALGAEMAKQLRETNRYEAADAITHLSPEFKEKAAQSAGDEALRAEVDLQTVAEERANVEDVTREADTDARKQADEVFKLAGKDPKDLPPGVSVEPGSTPDQATIVVKDEQGKVLERTTAQRDGDKITLDSTQYDKEGNAQRSIVASEGANGPTTVTQAKWKEPTSGNPGTPPSIDELKNSRDPNVSLSETTVRRDGDNLVQSSYTQDAQSGITQTEKTYGRQDDKDGITDRLDERFEDGPIDTVRIKTTNIPPEGAKGPDGEPAKASVTEGTSYSQGDVRLTGTHSKVVDSPADGEPPSAADLGEAAERAEDADSSPKSWQLEVSKTNELATQTFVEGQTDLSVVTRKKVEGNTVTETTEGKVPNPDGEGDPVSISGTSSRTYNDKGQVTEAHSDQTDATGTRRTSDYERTETRNAQGELEVTENTTSTEQPKDGDKRTLEQQQVAVQTDQGPQLVRASQTMTGPEGTAKASITPEGQELTVNGQKMESLEQLQGLPEDQASLGATTLDGLSQQVRDFNQLATDIHTAHLEQQAANNQGEQKAAVSANNYGLARLKQALTTNNSVATGAPDPTGGPATSRTPVPEWKKAPSISLSPTERLAGGATGGIQLLAGAAGLYTSGRSLINNLSQGNYVNAAKDALGLTASGISVYGGANALITAVRGSGSGLTLGGAVGTAGGRINPSVAGQVAGKFAVGLGVVAGGIEVFQGIKNGNGWQIASGAVTAGAAVGGYLAVGAAAGAWGGPAGAAVGLAIGLAAFGVTKLFDWFDDSEHDIADQKI